ncbi:MAG: TrbI/VirB10 family protein [Novosphingobium sp.]
MADHKDPRDEHQGAEIIDLATRSVLPVVTQRKRSEGFGLAGGVAIVVALGAFTLWSLDSARTAKPNRELAAAPRQSPTALAPQPITPAVPPAGFAPAQRELAAPPQSAVLAAPPQGANATAPAVAPGTATTLVFDTSARSAPFRSAAPAPGAPAGTSVPTDDFAARLSGGNSSGTATASASFDPKTTVTQGTLIPALLETAIDTDVPGYVRAVVSSDVRSFDGARVLVPRSSRLIGQYKSGLTAGQKRAYVIWTRLIRPDGVSVNLGSPAVSFGGETGLAGRVDSHFFARFGSAMLLSVIGGLSSIGSGAGVIVSGGGQSAAAAAVGQTGQIGPTIRVRQGEPIRVFTARDLDFSRVVTE